MAEEKDKRKEEKSVIYRNDWQPFSADAAPDYSERSAKMKAAIDAARATAPAKIAEEKDKRQSAADPVQAADPAVAQDPAKAQQPAAAQAAAAPAQAAASVATEQDPAKAAAQAATPAAAAPAKASPAAAMMPLVNAANPTENTVKNDGGTPKGYNQVQLNTVQNGQSASNTVQTAAQTATQTAEQQGHQTSTSRKTFDADAQRQAMEAGQDYINGAPSAYFEELDELGFGVDGPNRNRLMEMMDKGVPFAQAVQDIALEGAKNEKERAEKLARTKNTIANLMESFRLATDIASGFAGGNIYKREGNGKIVEQNRADIKAADEKYQRALDDFNNNMRNLKKDDLAERRRRAAQLGEVGFGTSTESDSTSNSNSTSNSTSNSNQSTATASTQSGSHNQFVQDQQFAADTAVRAAAARSGQQQKKVELSQPVYDPKTGKIIGYQRYEITEEQYRDRKPRALKYMREWADSTDPAVQKRIADIATNLGLEFDGKPDIEKVRKVLTGKYREKDENGNSIDYSKLEDEIVKAGFNLSQETKDVFLSDYTGKIGGSKTGTRRPGNGQMNFDEEEKGTSTPNLEPNPMD